MSVKVKFRGVKGFRVGTHVPGRVVKGSVYKYDYNSSYHYQGLFGNGSLANGEITRIEVLPDTSTVALTAVGDWADRYTLIYT